MSKWSEELQETTRKQVFFGAVMKDEDHNYGIFARHDGKVLIMGIQDVGILTLPTDEVLATFDSVDEMVEAGWVMD